MPQKTYILFQPHPYLDYTLEGLRGDPYFVLYPHRRLRTLWATIMRFIRTILPGKHPKLWTDYILPKEYCELLKSVKPGDKVIFWAVGNKKDIKIITEEANTGIFTVMLLDPLRQICHFSKREIREYPDIMRQLGVRVCTFDKEDAHIHGLDYVGQVYRMPVETASRQVVPRDLSTDCRVLFIGVDKRRAPKLHSLAKALKEEGIGYDFRIIYDKHSTAGRYPLLDRCRIEEPIPYPEVIRMEERSQCLLDILQPGQTGMTMRVLEAQFLGKKLITDNFTIKGEPFYLKENIYIIDDPTQPWRSIREFLETPTTPVNEEILREYDIRTWIKRL